MSTLAAWTAFALGLLTQVTAVVLPTALFVSGAVFPGIGVAQALVAWASVVALLAGGLAFGGMGVLGAGLDWRGGARTAGIANGMLMATGVFGLVLLSPGVLLLS